MRYAHTNIIARDWKKLAQFYIDVFDCEPMYPERDLSGEWIEKATGIKGVRIRGIHLRLPGYTTNGPTLEIFTYEPPNSVEVKPQISLNGFSHIAFEVDSVEDVLKKFLEHGGGLVGERCQKTMEGIGVLTMVYATDPEGNIVEILNWQR